MSYARIAGALLLILLAGAAARAQQSSCLERTIPFSLYAPDGSPPRNLEGAKLAASYGGKAIPMRSAPTAASRPMRMILLVDISGSMGAAVTADWNLPLDVADNLMAKMPAATEIGIAFFTTGLQHVINPTTDHQKLVDEVNAVRQSRHEKGPLNTALWDAIGSGVAMLDPPQAGDVVYVITDGGDNASKTRPQDAAQILGAAGVRLFTFELTDEPDTLNSYPEEETGQDQLRGIVADTGGGQILTRRPSVINFGDKTLVDQSGHPTGLAVLLDAQYRQILNVYRVTIELPGPVDKPRKWLLGLVGADKADKSLPVLLYPQKLFPCH